MGSDWNNPFEDDDPFDDPRWWELMANTPPRPAEGYVTVPLAWLARMRPVVRSADQLLVLLLLYRPTASFTISL